MLGGEVHGSLAHAGKVRGQTPKVAKQEKKTTTGQEACAVQPVLGQCCAHLWQEEGP